MNREICFRLLGIFTAVLLGTGFQQLLYFEELGPWHAMIETPLLWLLYIVVGFSVSEFLYNRK